MLNPFIDPIYRLSPLLVLFISFVLMVVVISKGDRSTGKWIFTGILLSVGFWGFLIFGYRTRLTPDDAIIWARLTSIPAIATFVFYYHFTVNYTGQRKQRWPVAFAYLTLAGIIILAPTGLIIEGIRTTDYGYAMNRGPWYLPVSLLTFPLLVGAMYNLATSYRKSKSYIERNRLLYLRAAIIFPVLASLLDAVTTLPRMLVWGQVSFVLVCCYATFRYHLLDIRVVFRRGLAYIPVSAIVALPYVVIIISLSHMATLNVETIWYSGIIIFILSMALHPVMHWAQTIVDRVFFRERFTCLSSLERLINETQSILDIDNLCETFLRSLTGSMGIETGCIMIKTSDNSHYEIQHCLDSRDVTGMRLSCTSQVVEWFLTQREALPLHDKISEPLLNSLSVPEKEFIGSLKAVILFPLFLRGTELVGILALGKKKNRRSYSIENRQLINTALHQMVISLENARLFTSEKKIRQELEQINHQKTDYLHSIAHEFKTPLTAILSSTELMDEGVSDTAMKTRLLTNIRRSAQVMNRRITDILDIARDTIGVPDLKTSPLELKSILIDSAAQVLVFFENKNQKLNIDIHETTPAVEADKEKIQQVLFNLLINAGNRSPKGSVISLRVFPDNGEVQFTIQDTAPQLSDDDMKRVFDVDFRFSDNASTDESTKSSLGLVISKKIIELHHGTIKAEPHPDGGNVFTFTLPVSHAHAS
jgi:signal transduction histidine kinase